jgi:uncharacterized protein involved in response to NO
MRYALFASGFRPMFLLCGLAAVALVPIWVLVWSFGQALPGYWPPTLWHAHEMMFGFVSAAIAGFLLTAVPSWTGSRGFAGLPLVVLATLWLAARLLIACAPRELAWVTLVVDVGFLVFLGILVAPPLLRSTNRNTPLLVVLAVFAVCNSIFHVAVWRHDAGMALRAIVVAIDIALLLVTIVGGRIVPAFTANALRASGSPTPLYTWRGVGTAAIGAMVVVTLGDLFLPDSRVAGVLAGIAAAIQAVRFFQWRGLATLRNPIVWVLHLGYVWLPIGLALKAGALLGQFAATAFWLHALTIGVLATMVLAVMTRAALGHTGRSLVVEPAIALGYVMLLAAALVRVFGLAVLHLPYPTVILLSAACWVAAFGIFSYVYVPILWLPRADGKPG